MNSKNTCLRATMALGLALGSTMAHAGLEASDVKIGGDVQLGAWSDIVPSNSFRAKNFGNIDALLNAEVTTDNHFGTWVQLRARSFKDSTPTFVDFGQGRPTESLEPKLSLDQFDLRWTVTPGATLAVGSWRQSKGELVGDPLFGNGEQAAAILRDRRITGISLNAGGVDVRLGLPGDRNQALTAYANYRHPLINENRRKLEVEPTVEVNFGNRDRHPFVLASEIAWSETKPTWRYVTRGIGSMFGDPDSKESSYGVLAEAGIEKGIWSLNGSAWQFFPGGTNAVARSLNPMNVDQHFRAEPAVGFGVTALSLPVTWTNPSDDLNNEEFWLILPTVSFYPNAKSDVRFFIGSRLAETAFGPFVESKASGLVGLRANLKF